VWGARRALAAAGHREASSLVGGDAEGGDGLFGVIECVRGEGVVGPAAFLSEGDEARVPEGAQVEGEEGLAAVERALEIADTLLALPEQVEDPQTADIREGVKERSVALQALGGGGKNGGGHASTYLD